MRLGTVLPVPGLSLRDSLALGVVAESVGFDDVWTSEIDAQDGFTCLAALSSLTRSVRLGVSLVPAQTRPPALLAMTAASLQDLSDGRFVLGLGSSTPTVVEGWMGGDHARPLTRLRETLAAVRLALTGERVDLVGETLAMRGFRLRLSPTAVPLMVGALGPRALALAGEEADGVLLSYTAAAAVPGLLADVWSAASAAGRATDGLDVVCRVPVAFGQDSPELRAALRRLLVGYAVVPTYAASFVRQGFGEEVAAIGALWRAGARDEAASAVTDAMLAGLTVFGSPDVCAERLHAYRDAGVRTLLVSPVTAPGVGDRHAVTAEALTAVSGLGLQ